MQLLTNMKHKGTSRLNFTFTPMHGFGPDESFKAHKMILPLSAEPQNLSKAQAGASQERSSLTAMNSEDSSNHLSKKSHLENMTYQ